MTLFAGCSGATLETGWEGSGLEEGRLGLGGRPGERAGRLLRGGGGDRKWTDTSCIEERGPFLLQERDPGCQASRITAPANTFQDARLEATQPILTAHGCCPRIPTSRLPLG